METWTEIYARHPNTSHELPFNISGWPTYKHLRRITHMLKIVRFSIRPSRIFPWRLFTGKARKVFYSTLKQAMTLPKYKYVDVGLSYAKLVNPPI